MKHMSILLIAILATFALSQQAVAQCAAEQTARAHAMPSSLLQALAWQTQPTISGMQSRMLLATQSKETISTPFMAQ